MITFNNHTSYVFYKTLDRYQASKVIMLMRNTSEREQSKDLILLDC